MVSPPQPISLIGRRYRCENVTEQIGVAVAQFVLELVLIHAEVLCFLRDRVFEQVGI